MELLGPLTARWPPIRRIGVSWLEERVFNKRRIHSKRQKFTITKLKHSDRTATLLVPAVGMEVAESAETADCIIMHGMNGRLGELKVAFQQRYRVGISLGKGIGIIGLPCKHTQ